MAKTFEPVEPKTSIPTRITMIDVEAKDYLPSEIYPNGLQSVEFRLSVNDQNDQIMVWESGNLSEHLDEKSYEDFMKAIEKLRKKAENEILP